MHIYTAAIPFQLPIIADPCLSHKSISCIRRLSPEEPVNNNDKVFVNSLALQDLVRQGTPDTRHSNPG